LEGYKLSLKRRLILTIIGYILIYIVYSYLLMSLIKEKKMMIYNILDFMLPFILGFWVGIFLKNKGAIYALVFGLTINVFTFIFSLTLFENYKLINMILIWFKDMWLSFAITALGGYLGELYAKRS